MVFERWHPFATGMERIVTLRNLREKGELPTAWKAQNPIVAKLVLWLTSGNPSHRPTAKELLRSDFMPARVGDEQLQDLIRSLEDDTETHDRVIEGVIKSSKAMKRSEGPGVMANDLTGAPCLQYGSQIEIQDRVCMTIKEIFSRHGAMPMASQDVNSLCFATI